MSKADDPHDTPHSSGSVESAANIARHKIAALYRREPNVEDEIAEAEAAGPHKSKHQKYMQELTTSGMSLEEIQTAWHNYYVGLPDDEKREVWQEFYDANKPESTQAEQEHAEKPASTVKHKPPESVADIKKRITSKVAKSSKVSKKHHLQSVLFGLGMGSIVILIFLFSFFNERFIAPFITPSRNVSSTPIILDPNSTEAGPESEVIIPKINVEIPVVYDAPAVKTASTADELENAIQNSLEDGVVHYPTTAKPGERGNVAIVGHSSNNIFNQGKYKFAFVLLSKLDEGDTFYLTKGGVRYAYRIYKKEIVKPNEIGVLGAQDKASTATLITCDPPGTSVNRLIVVGEQISPDPNKNKAVETKQAQVEPQIVPGNAPSLWQRIKDWFS